MPDDKKPAVDWESFSAGLTVPTNIKYTMIRFDVTGKAKNRATFIKHAAPQIMKAINEIAEAIGVTFPEYINLMQAVGANIRLTDD